MERREHRHFQGPSGNKPKGQRRSPVAKLDLSNAYREVFFGNATAQQREMVLVHMAEMSGFYKVQPPGLTHDERAYHEGARSVFGLVVANTSMTPDERYALEEASRHEAFVSQIEGELI
jgi:hypothetical protein